MTDTDVGSGRDVIRESEEAKELKKHAAKMATVGVGAIVSLLVLGYGAFKLYPLTSQITTLVNTVGELEEVADKMPALEAELSSLRSDHARLSERVKDATSNHKQLNRTVSDFQLILFPSVQKDVETKLNELVDVTGDNEDRVTRLTDDVDTNTAERIAQVRRATERIKDQSYREERLRKLEAWRESGQVDRIDIRLEAIESSLKTRNPLSVD